MHVDAYFDKPLDPARLIAAIAALLAAREGAAGGPRGSAENSVAGDCGAGDVRKEA